MNFDFSADQRLLQEAAHRMLAATSTSTAVRKILEGDAPYSEAVWRELINMGAAAAAIPEVYGGSGMGYLELCLVAEEAGRHLAPVPLSSSFYLAAEALIHGGSDVQKQQWLPRLASGELIATAHLGSVESYLDGSANKVAGGKLTGRYVLPDGMVAGLAIVRVEENLLAVDLTAQGVTRKAITSLDPTRPYAQINFDATPVDVLAGEASTGAVAARVLNGAAVLLAFEQLGGADQVLQNTKEYSLERKAFGRQIGSFQALKHKMADIYTANQLARAHVYYGAWALSSEAPELALAAGAARVSATVAYNSAAEESIEIHGGIGFTWEMDCHLHMRRARFLAQVIGTEHAWRAQLANELIGEAA